MRVKLRGISVYSDLLGDLTEVEAEEGITVGELISRIIPKRVEIEYGLVFFVNSIPSDNGRKLADGDIIEIAPRFSGG
jgi:molybdopterin converting factor small subunit